MDGDSPGYKYPYLLAAQRRPDKEDHISIAVEMYTVEHSKSEIVIHKEELLCKSKLDEKSFDYLNEIIFGRVNLVPMQEIEPFRRTAEEIMCNIDLDDAPFLALALYLKCPIWSNDDHFKRQSAIKAVTTRVLLGLLKISV